MHRMSRATARTGNRPRVGLGAQLIQINAHETCDQRGSNLWINCHRKQRPICQGLGFFFKVSQKTSDREGGVQMGESVTRTARTITFTCQFSAIWAFKSGPRLCFQTAAGLDKKKRTVFHWRKNPFDLDKDSKAGLVSLRRCWSLVGSCNGIDSCASLPIETGECTH